MTTKTEMIALLKAENPTLRIGNDNDGYTELSAADYDATIDEWADARLAKETKLSQIAADALAKKALLEKLGITQEEAALLLGAN
jgi:hypothetical protein